jgi:hypothetical protein
MTGPLECRAMVRTKEVRAYQDLERQQTIKFRDRIPDFRETLNARYPLDLLFFRRMTCRFITYTKIHFRQHAVKKHYNFTMKLHISGKRLSIFYNRSKKDTLSLYHPYSRDTWVSTHLFLLDGVFILNSRKLKQPVYLNLYPELWWDKPSRLRVMYLAIEVFNLQFYSLHRHICKYL